MGTMLRFAVPMILGNLLQQCYNIADTLIVGHYLGADALAAVGSAYTLMVFITSVFIGLCMGSGVVFSNLWGQGRREELKNALVNAFGMIALMALGLTLLSYALLDALAALLRVPAEAVLYFTDYLRVIFGGIVFVFLYNFFAAVLRSVGNSAAPLVFLLVSTVLNVALDLYLVLAAGWGVAGAAWATVIAQGVSALGIMGYFFLRMPDLCPGRRHFRVDGALLRRVAGISLLTSVQQSIMNFGILMIQSLVNSFGVPTMAAFAAGVKIDSLAYSPAQDFANGFATFVAQNRGAGKQDRVRRGIREGAALSLGFCAAVSALVYVFAEPLLGLFLENGEAEIVRIGVGYLRLEGVFYLLIGLLFLLYAIYRGLEKAGMSVVLTVTSLGLRVALAYAFAPAFGVTAIWLSIPIGWLIADAVGLLGLRKARANR